MGGGFYKWSIGVAAVLAAVGASAAPAKSDMTSNCHVVGGEKLPAETGGSKKLCEAVEQAIAAQAPKASYSAEVHVVSRSRLTASLIVDGRALPLQNFAVMDRGLSESSIEHFASGLAAEVAKAAAK